MADTLREITCPACDTKMTKIYMEEAGINIDVCLDGCGGILFNNRELEKFDEQHENADDIFNAYEGKTFKPVEQSEVRLCTICNTPMVKQGAGVGNIEIDVCNTCGAKFLDYGELEKIRKLKDKDSKYRAKVDTLVDAVVAENQIPIGGGIGSFAQRHVKITPLRTAFENFVSGYLENK